MISNQLNCAPNSCSPDNTATMLQAPKGMRLHIGVFGRRNAGKSSLINALTRQNTSIVSNKPGTTTDPVEKAMELLPIGPVLLIDTAGIDDIEESLGDLRIARTRAVLGKTDIAIIVTTPQACLDTSFSLYELRLIQACQEARRPWLLVINKTDLASEHKPTLSLLPKSLSYQPSQIVFTCLSSAESSKETEKLKLAIVGLVPAELMQQRPILSDLVAPNGNVILVVPIDKEAPKGRIILPQVQAIRDLLDASCTAVVTQVSTLGQTLENFKTPPSLVVTDSQAFKEVAQIVPSTIPLTSFSVLFSRFKGDLALQVQGAKHIASLRPGSRVLIAEACTHHPIADDIGTVKIPKLLTKYVGGPLQLEHAQGKDFPSDLRDFELVIHCGACTLNRSAMLSRLEQCRQQGVAVTNYGLAIAMVLGILERSTAMFDL